MHLVYILFSEKINRFYIGYTTDLEKRIFFHQNDSQSRKFTYNAEDWKVFFTIQCTSKKQALDIEKHIKKMKSKTYIENIKKYPDIIQKLLLKYQNKDG